MADNTGAVKPADFHATSEQAETPAFITESEPSTEATDGTDGTDGSEITTQDFHATSEPFKPADFHATGETA